MQSDLSEFRPGIDFKSSKYKAPYASKGNIKSLIPEGCLLPDNSQKHDHLCALAPNMRIPHAPERIFDPRKCESSLFLPEVGVIKLNDVVGYTLPKVGEVFGRVFDVNPEDNTIGVTIMVKHAFIEQILTQYRKKHLSPIFEECFRTEIDVCDTGVRIHILASQVKCMALCFDNDDFSADLARNLHILKDPRWIRVTCQFNNLDFENRPASNKANRISFRAGIQNVTQNFLAHTFACHKLAVMHT
jgi:hypothetical protein